jgi:hypothetical protein
MVSIRGNSQAGLKTMCHYNNILVTAECMTKAAADAGLYRTLEGSTWSCLFMPGDLKSPPGAQRGGTNSKYQLISIPPDQDGAKWNFYR